MRNTFEASVLAASLIAGGLAAPAATAAPAAAPAAPASSSSNADTGAPAGGAEGWFSFPQSLNPAEWLKRELDGYATMSSKLAEGDFAGSLRGLGQAASVVAAVTIGDFVIGQATELVMRAIRNSNAR